MLKRIFLIIENRYDHNHHANGKSALNDYSYTSDDDDYEMKEKYRCYFYAFDLTHKSIISFTDFVLGLAAMEPLTQHGGVPAEQRCRYIFRYYSYNDPDTNYNHGSTKSGNEISNTNNQFMTFSQFK